MGRCRWRFTLAAFLLLAIKEIQSQDENDFDYPLVERSFAQVQPPLFANSRPSTFFDHGDSYRISQVVQQPIYNQGAVRLPSPKYNQNPSPFQLPTGRSQSGTQYYINQPEVTQQRQRFRPSLPYNFQFHPASTKKPDVVPIHSIAYQNDPSKPETFLGQVTLNNPDIDYLQNSRFRNIPFDGSNSLKNNGQGGNPINDDDVENEDLFDHHKVTTYNPTRVVQKQNMNSKPSRYSHFDSLATDNKANLGNKPYTGKSNTKPQKINSNIYTSSSTEYKPLLDIEPLLEDEISDLSTFRELMKNTQGSFDVQVIKSKLSNISTVDDSKPDASFMESDNLPKQIGSESLNMTTAKRTTSKVTTIAPNSQHEYDSEEIEDDGEYVEYYDDTESPEVKHATNEPPTTDNLTDIYDEYDSTEEPEKTVKEINSNSTGPFDVLVMKPASTMVADDNFKQFVDTTVIDQTDQIDKKDLNRSNTYDPVSEDVTSLETPSILGQEVVSVVTTKSVVNGTISVPDVTIAPSTTKIVSETESEFSSFTGYDSSLPITTENWIVVASVQTSRSVSGARFLPFPTVEQEEKKQVLTDEKDLEDEENVTKVPKQETGKINSSPSTENINDKLDSIQSELSSAVLSGRLNNENKHIELIAESTTEKTTTMTTTTKTTTTSTTAIPNIFTLKSTQPQSTTVKSSPEPLPVMVKKFTPRMTTSTTPKPKKKLVTIMDELPVALLPAGYKPKLSFKDKRTSTTTPSTTTAKATSTRTTKLPSRSSGVTIINSTQARSSGITTKNKVIILDDKSLLPKEYKPKEHKPQDDLFRKVQTNDTSKFLPPDYKLQLTEKPEIKETTKADIIDKVRKQDITAFLPTDFNTNSSSSEKPKIESKLPIKIAPVDITAFLPPGFKSNDTGPINKDIPLENITIADISNLLPPDFKLNVTEELTPASSTTKAPGGIKLVFPSRPGGKTNRKVTTPKSLGPPPVTPKIQKGWPTRASTEFTGWPSPSTTPFSIEKLLEAQRNATATSPLPELSTETTTRRITTTTTTTPVPPPPTTPGVCRKDCDIAATIKIVSGVKWVPELLDHHTDEWQRLADDVKNELNSVYTRSDYLKKWYKDIRIEGFSEGSVLVDYFIELNNIEERVDTVDLKKMFHKSLDEAKAGSVLETVTEASEEEFNPDVMLGDQPDEERMNKSNKQMTKTIDKSAGKLMMGKFVVDPAFTEYIVLEKREVISQVTPDEEAVLPQWGIAVIVIAMASLLFVVIFGVTVLVNRQKNSKAKSPIPLSEDMLRELDKSHMGGYDDIHQLKDRELPYLPSGKRMSTAFIEQLAYPNPGDSWRSEWTPQLQKYMQHYTPDSGRGSQTYGPVGNGYGYSGSQAYGQTGGGSQLYGYNGEYQRSHYPRRRSDYDSNF